MSFLLDLPSLVILGFALYFIGKIFELKRLTKIAIGLLIVLTFVLFSALLYADVFRFRFLAIPASAILQLVFPGVDWKENYFNISGSEWMLTSGIWPIGLTKNEFPLIFVIILFLLYPVAFYFGYASALLISKKLSRTLHAGSKSYDNVKSRIKISSQPKYSIVRYPDDQNDINDLKEAVGQAVLKLGGMRNFVQPNDKVLIKVNICGGIPENPASYTSLEVTGAVVDLVKSAGGRPIICDADMIWAKFQEQARTIGWTEWAKKNEVELVNLSETDLTYFDFGEGSPFDSELKPNQDIISKQILDADVIISIPKMKTHLMTSITMGMKNMYGTLPEEDKAKYHQSGIDDVIYWVNYAFTPTLTIIDGTIGGEAIGPLSVNPVQFDTIIASNNVVIADAIASKLIGIQDPFSDVGHLRLARERMGQKWSLLKEIPEDLYLTGQQLISKFELPANPKDGNWQLTNPLVVEKYNNLMENLLAIPGIDTFFNIGADFILFDAARIPLLRIVNHALLEILYEAPRFWVRKTPRTKLKNQMRINLMIYALLVVFSGLFFIKNEYFRELNLSIGIILGYILALLFGVWIARNVRTKHLITIILSSLLIGYFVESSAFIAKWWNYPNEQSPLHGLFYLPYPPPYWPLLVIPIFIINILGFAYFLSPVLSYVGLKGERFRLAPYSIILFFLLLIIYLEGYLVPLALPTRDMIIIYCALAILSLYSNEKQSLDWNLAIVIVSVTLGWIMEFLGFRGQFWNYYDINNINYFMPVMPIFVSLTWALNTSAICGLALIFGIDLRKAFIKDESLDVSDPGAWTHKGNALTDQGNYKEGLEYYNSAIEILTHSDMKDDIIYKNEGDIRYQLAEAWFGKGNLLASQGDYKASIEAYNQAIKLYNDSSFSSAKVKVAQTYYRKAIAKDNLEGFARAAKVYDEAIRTSKEAIRINPNGIDTLIDAWVDKAISSQDTRKFEDSIRVFDEAAIFLKDLKPGFDASTNLAKLLDLKGFARVYEADIQGQIQNNDKNPKLKQYADALKNFDEAIKISSKSSEQTWLAGAYWGIGYAQNKLGNYEKALEAFDKALIGLDLKNAAFVWSDKGDALLDCLDKKMSNRALVESEIEMRCIEALQAYENAIKLFPLWENVSMAQAWRGKQNKFSKKFISKAWKGKGDAHSKIADLKHADSLKLREQDFALKAYRRSIDILGEFFKDIDAGSAKGDILSRMARFKEAHKAFNDAIETVENFIAIDVEGTALKVKSEIDWLKGGPWNVGETIRISSDRNPMVSAQIIEVRGEEMMLKLDRDIAEEADQNPIIRKNIFGGPRNAESEIRNILLAKAWTGKGNVLIGLGKKDEARIAFKEALKKSPNYLPALFGESTLDLQNKAMISSGEIDPRNAEIWLNRASFLRHFENP